MPPIKYRSEDVDGLKVFYRDAGPANAPVLLLLHGFPSASHMFRDLIPLLAGRFHIIAPDLPGFGQSEMPARSKFSYTFDNIAGVIDRFTEVAGLKRFAIYVFDYGAPVGFRIATKHPDRITAIISQNGNAYEEGLSEGWGPIRAYWQDPSQANREALRAFLAPESTRWQYSHGVADVTMVSPDGQSLDNFYLARPGADEVQLDLLCDYKSNVALYQAFQAYFRTHKPPLLAVWGKNDPFFLPIGAEAFKRDIPGAAVRFFDTGHFALETHAVEIAGAIGDFPRTLIHAWRFNMRAIVLEKFGGLDSLVYKEIPDPEPKAGHVVIEIKAFGINHAEMHMRRGEWAEAAKVIGIECVGLVKSCPGGEFPVGAKVAALMGGLGRTINGSYAEYTRARSSNVALIESDPPWAELAAIPETYGTAWTCLFRNHEMEAK